jgi:hypothetical protein
VEVRANEIGTMLSIVFAFEDVAGTTIVVAFVYARPLKDDSV